MDGHTGAFSSDGQRVLTTNNHSTVRVWDAATGKQLVEFNPGLLNWFSAAAFSPDGKRILTANDDSTARVWDAATGKQLVEMGSALVQTPFVVGMYSGPSIVIVTAAFSPDGQRILTARSDEAERVVWDAETGKQLAKLNGLNDKPQPGEGFKDRTAAFSPDGQLVVATNNTLPAMIYRIVPARDVEKLFSKREVTR